MSSRIAATWRWLDSRLGIAKLWRTLALHPAPPDTAWWYVFGTATLTLFLIQVVTGICLALVYVPSTATAYDTLQYLNDDYTLGWLMRALHNVGASGMVVLLLVHMTRVFLMGAFKFPREMTWIAGVVLLFTTLGMCFTGQVLRWDQDAYWTVGVAAAMVGRVPYVGPELVKLVIGGANIGSEALTRFYAVHVFIFPGILFAVIGLHLYLVLRHGISERPVPGEAVDPATYREKYQRVLASGSPFYPEAALRDSISSALAVIVVVILAVLIGPEGPALPPDPTLIQATPRPDWYFMPFFTLLALCPRWLETYMMLGLPAVMFVILVLVPLVASRGKRSVKDRPVAVLTVVLLAVTLPMLVIVGYQSHWSPHMQAWTAVPVPQHIVEGLKPLELQGAVILQNKDCRNCHALDGKGGFRGPELTTVGRRLHHNELVRQVIQGGGDMPAFGDRLSPAEVEAVVAFLSTLGQPPPKAMKAPDGSDK
jgi:ubiquinol-cytochrome c reductase cytochrome b subunit